MASRRPDRSLGDAIFMTLRAEHFKLDKLVLKCLPLAMPDQAADPSAYVTGLLHIAPVYIAFEALWENVLRSRPARDACQLGDHSPSARRPSVSERVLGMLARMRLPGLVRGDRLRADIAALTRWPPHAIEGRLRDAAATGSLGEFVDHIKRAVEARPHVLVTYGYILYMALFSGGRIIRSQLERSGSEFWAKAPAAVTGPDPCRARDQAVIREQGHCVADSDADAAASAPQCPDTTASDAPPNAHAARHKSLPLTFLHFGTPRDGEDLKDEFKRRMAESSAILTDQETDDIIDEGRFVLGYMTRVVEQLEDVCAAIDGRPKPDGGAYVEVSAVPLHCRRVRDSVAVARERSTRSPGADLSESGDDAGGEIGDAEDENADAAGDAEGDAENEDADAAGGASPLPATEELVAAEHTPAAVVGATPDATPDRSHPASGTASPPKQKSVRFDDMQQEQIRAAAADSSSAAASVSEAPSPPPSFASPTRPTRHGRDGTSKKRDPSAASVVPNLVVAGLVAVVAWWAIGGGVGAV